MTDAKAQSLWSHAIQIVCPFCLDPLDQSDIDSVQSHLAAAHSFHVPHSHAITDWPGLLLYLETKIHDLGHCLHCHATYWNPHWTPDMMRTSDSDSERDEDDDNDQSDDDDDEELPEMRDAFRSGQDALKHMFARGHNAIRMESGGWREYASFYDTPEELFVTKVPELPSQLSANGAHSSLQLARNAPRLSVHRPSKHVLANSSSDQPPPPRVRAVIRAGDSRALAQDLALQHSIPIHQANKLARSGVKSAALTTMSTSDIRHLAKTMEQAEKSTRRAQMSDSMARGLKANKHDRLRFAGSLSN
ncbi:hypothetical protein BCR44DRAFT_94815 [Catenaria anguillulae PL171]|uniref:ZN622/Rei1/Reh1 zinc finger C2H2-type domain-containing protein n=1 Tax=Catenaria anguillulae PL171 TaxID=765915 RepID=A0A1Y2HD93_9FUNG|nr:hypothetical protein BCR44DRAFT_94815 [Catenaria anguillulae PL171]